MSKESTGTHKTSGQSSKFDHNTLSPILTPIANALPLLFPESCNLYMSRVRVRKWLCTLSKKGWEVEQNG